MIVVITLTCNRVDLTKRWLSQLKNKAGKEFFHIIVDNGSTDSTIEYLKEYLQDQKGTILKLKNNVGIIKGFLIGVKHALSMGADYIVKYDNDCEILTDNILARLCEWFEKGCDNYVISPIDLHIIDEQQPKTFAIRNERGFEARYTTHTGGIFKMIPKKAAQMLLQCENIELIGGDLLRGRYWIGKGISPVYLLDLEVKHQGIGKQTKNYKLK